jgi:hypothetical protein
LNCSIIVFKSSVDVDGVGMTFASGSIAPACTADVVAVVVAVVAVVVVVVAVVVVVMTKAEKKCYCYLKLIQLFRLRYMEIRHCLFACYCNQIITFAL